MNASNQVMQSMLEKYLYSAEDTQILRQAANIVREDWFRSLQKL